MMSYQKRFLLCEDCVSQAASLISAQIKLSSFFFFYRNSKRFVHFALTPLFSDIITDSSEESPSHPHPQSNSTYKNPFSNHTCFKILISCVFFSLDFGRWQVKNVVSIPSTWCHGWHTVGTQ